MLFPQRSIKWTFGRIFTSQPRPSRLKQQDPSHDKRSSECRQTKCTFFGIGMLHRLLMIPANHWSASVGDTNIAMDAR